MFQEKFARGAMKLARGAARQFRRFKMANEFVIRLFMRVVAEYPFKGFHVYRIVCRLAGAIGSHVVKYPLDFGFRSHRFYVTAH